MKTVVGGIVDEFMKQQEVETLFLSFEGKCAQREHEERIIRIMMSMSVILIFNTSFTFTSHIQNYNTIHLSLITNSKKKVYH